MAAVEQNYKNHARLIPSYHIGVLVTLLANIIWQFYQVIQAPSVGTTLATLVAIALFWMGVSLRTQTLTVQDRVIRLESRLRFRELLPADVAARAAELPVKQLVAIRFASDEELPELVGDVVAGKVTEPKAIKLAIKQWQADHLRA
jgi:hypothetical protein